MKVDNRSFLSSKLGANLWDSRLITTSSVLENQLNQAKL